MPELPNLQPGSYHLDPNSLFCAIKGLFSDAKKYGVGPLYEHFFYNEQLGSDCFPIVVMGEMPVSVRSNYDSFIEALKKQLPGVCENPVNDKKFGDCLELRFLRPGERQEIAFLYQISI